MPSKVTLPAFYINSYLAGYGSACPRSYPGKMLTVLYAVTSIPLFFFTVYKSAQLLVIAGAHLQRQILGASPCFRRHHTTETIELMKQDGTIEDPKTASTKPNDSIMDHPAADPESPEGKEIPKQGGSLDLESPEDSIIMEHNGNNATVLNPIIPMFLLLIYIFSGACLFIEPSEHQYWGYWNAVYFICVSLTTIGYGAYVPANTASHIYLFIGLILVAASILACVEFCIYLQPLCTYN